MTSNNVSHSNFNASQLYGWVSENMETIKEVKNCLSNIPYCIGKGIWNEVQPLALNFMSNGLYDFSNFAVRKISEGMVQYIGKPWLRLADDIIHTAANFFNISNPQFYEKTSGIYHVSVAWLSNADRQLTELVIPSLNPENHQISNHSFRITHLLIPAWISYKTGRWSSEYYAKAFKVAKKFFQISDGFIVSQVSNSKIQMGIVDHDLIPPRKELLLELLSESAKGTTFGMIHALTTYGMKNHIVEAGVSEEQANLIFLTISTSILAAPLFKVLFNRFSTKLQELPTLIESLKPSKPSSRNEENALVAVKKFKTRWDEKTQKFIYEPTINNNNSLSEITVI